MFCCVGWFALARIRENQAPVPGWIQFGNTKEEDPIFRFWLPKYYEGINPRVVTLMIQNAAEDFSSQYPSWLDDVKVVFAARDTRKDDFQPAVLVSYSATAPGTENVELSLERIRARANEQTNIKLIDSDVISLNNYKAIFLAYDTNVEELEFRQIQYIIIDGDITWSVIYLPDKDKYDEELSVFEKSIQTFQVHQ